MSSVYLELGRYCDRKCIMCPLPIESETNTWLSLDKALESIRKFRQADPSVEHVRLSGGEPTLYPHLTLLLSGVAEMSLRAEILTHGGSIYPERLREWVSAIPAEKLCLTVALYGTTAKTHDAIVGRDGAFEKTIRGIDHASSFGLDVSIKIVVCRLNLPEVAEMPDYLRTNLPGVRSLYVGQIDYVGRARQNCEQLLLDFAEQKNSLESLLDQVRQWKKTRTPAPMVAIFDTPLCAVDPSYWEFFSYPAVHRLSGYQSAGGKDADACFTCTPPLECGAFFEPCHHCVVRPRCPGTWRSTARMLGDQAFRAYQIHEGSIAFAKK